MSEVVCSESGESIQVRSLLLGQWCVCTSEVVVVRIVVSV